MPYENLCVSMSLYGDLHPYLAGAIRNATRLPETYPEAMLIIYHDRTVPQETISELKRLKCVMHDMTDEMPLAGHKRMLWRFLAADETETGRPIMISRDADCTVSDRERWCLDDWFTRKTMAFTIRDSESHCSVPMCGGMWGCKAVFKGIRKKLAKWNSNDGSGFDQTFLSMVVWPCIRDWCTVYAGGRALGLASGHVTIQGPEIPGSHIGAPG